MWPEAHLIGWDIGGAHLKAAWFSGGELQEVRELATPLWRGLAHLEHALAELARDWPLARAGHLFTMTGELVDLFDDRASGVQALCDLMREHLPDGAVAVYAGPRGFIPPEQAKAHLHEIASANWHASVALAARLESEGLLVDLGSTTADLLLFAGGRPLVQGYSDRERQASEELVYTGVVRTPLMALCEQLPMDGEWVGLAAEHFATTADVYRLTGELPVHADLGDTADGRGKRRSDSARRLARMVGMDLEQRPEAAWQAMACYLRDRQLDRLYRAASRQLSQGLSPSAPLYGAGVGRFLVRRLAARLDRPYRDFSELLPRPLRAPAADAADCAPAVAVAMLATAEDWRCAC